MKASTENQVEGAVHQAKGKIKETVGHLTDNPSLEAKGAGEQVVGKVQKKIGQLQKVIEKP